MALHKSDQVHTVAEPLMSLKGSDSCGFAAEAHMRPLVSEEMTIPYTLGKLPRALVL